MLQNRVRFLSLAQTLYLSELFYVISKTFLIQSSKEFYALKLYDICINSHNFYIILCCTIVLFTILILLREVNQDYSCSVYLAANAHRKSWSRIESLKYFYFMALYIILYGIIQR